MGAQEFVVGLLPGIVAFVVSALAAFITLEPPTKRAKPWWLTAFVILGLAGVVTMVWQQVLASQRQVLGMGEQAALRADVASLKGELRAMRRTQSPREETRRQGRVLDSVDRAYEALRANRPGVAQDELAEVRKDMEAMRARDRPRRLTDAQKAELIAVLREVGATHTGEACANSGTRESVQYRDDFLGIFNELKWSYKATQYCMLGDASGLLIFARDDDVGAKKLTETLTRFGIEFDLPAIDPDQHREPNSLDLVVGSRYN